MGVRMNLHKNYQAIAEERANKSFVNCEVLNSYYVGEDGKSYWYEVILVDRAHPSVLADKRTAGITRQRGRAYRGLTSAGRRTRGLHNKGMGAEKIRPSRRANSV
jgi:large subunit ribosomal protein L15e